VAKTNAQDHNMAFNATSLFLEKILKERIVIKKAIMILENANIASDKFVAKSSEQPESATNKT